MKTEKGVRVRNFVMFLCTPKTNLSTALCHVDYYITVWLYHKRCGKMDFLGYQKGQSEKHLHPSTIAITQIEDKTRKNHLRK